MDAILDFLTAYFVAGRRWLGGTLWQRILRAREAAGKDQRMPDIVELFLDLLANPFRNRWANRFFQLLFGSLAALLAFLMLRSLF